jgi:hypothetical protein
MKVRWGLLFCACAALSPVTIKLAAAAEFRNDVQELYRWCKEPRSSPNHLYCLGYLGGVGDTLWMTGVCGGDFPSRDAMVQAFVNWAEKHPEKWGIHAGEGAILTFGEAWACPAK